MIITGGGDDYISGPYTVTFLSQATSASFDIAITQDSKLEDDENFAIAIDQTSLPARVSLGNLRNATVTIVDDESMLIIKMYQ